MNQSTSKDRGILRNIFNVLYFLFFILLSILSILFFQDSLNIYKVISWLNLDKPFVERIMRFVQIKQVMVVLWGINLVAAFLWAYLNFSREKLSKEHDAIINILKTQEKSEKLIGYMLSQSFGNILWAGDLFSKIFKIKEQDVGKDFLEILKNHESYALSQSQLDNIISNFKLKKTFYIDLPLNVASQNGAFRLTYVSLGNLYLWQVMLVQQDDAQVESFVTEGLLNLSLPTFILNSSGRILHVNSEFIDFFRMPNNVDLDSIEITDLIYENPISHKEIKFNWLPKNTIVNSVICKDIESNEFEAVVLQQNIHRENIEVVEYIRNIILPIYDHVNNSKQAKELLLENKAIMPYNIQGEEPLGMAFSGENSIHNLETTALTDDYGFNIKEYNINNFYKHKEIFSKMGEMNNDNGAYLQEMFNFAPMGILMLNEENKIILANKKFYDEFFINEEIILDSLAEEVDFNNKILPFLDKGLSDFEINYEIKKENKLFKVSAFKIDGNKQILYFIDITKSRDLEVQVKLSQGLQTIGQIASVVAHDFNNLLTAIINFTHFAQEKQDEDDPVRAELEQIKQNANRATVMIRQLLTFSRKQELKPEEFDVNSEISDLMSTIIRLIGDRVSSNFKRGKNIGKILMDKVQFQQVVTNLVVNAKDAMKQGGKLDIITSATTLKNHKDGILGVIPAGEYVLIELKDEGEGIKKENLKLIFQAHFSTKGEKGNGLGLSTVNKIITDNAGFIDIKSVVGKGTSFFLYLPKLPEKVVELKQSVTVKTKPEKAVEALDLTGNETILLVEDEVAVRMVCSRLLKSKGYNVIEAESGDEAVDMLVEIKHIDLVISDVMMPGISGPELIARVKEEFPGIKSILMSGYAEDILEDINSDTSIKGIEFLSKPFSVDVLASKVRSVLKNTK